MKKLICIMALLCAVAVQADAQSLKDILSGAVKQVVGDKATTETSLIGTWAYVGPDCQLKGDDLLKNIGGDAAGVDFISFGALTHSVKGMDMSFKAC